MRIVFLLGFHPNQRMNKRIRLLMKQNDVSVIYWQKNRDKGAYGTDIATDKCSCIDIHFNERSLNERFLAFRKFKRVVKEKLDKLQPDCIYVQNLDLFLFAEQYKRKKKNSIKLVYEVSDINDILIQPQRSIVKKTIQFYLRRKEKRACKNLDLFCYTSPAFCSERYGELISEERRMYLPNIPDLSYFDSYQPQDVNEFTVGYVGTIRYEEKIRVMLEAAKIAGVKALVAGGVASGGSRGLRVDVDGLKKDYPETEFIGAFDYTRDIAGIYSKINVSFAVYNADLKNVRIALPNKLYEAIKCEIPIIVAPDTYLAETVVSLGVGGALETTEEIAEFLRKLKRDAVFYKSFKRACKNNSAFIDARETNENLCAWFLNN